MVIETRQLGNITVLCPLTDLTFYNLLELRQKAKAIMGGSASKKYIIDLSHVKIMDSAGAGFLVSVYRPVLDVCGSLAILRPCESVKATIEAIGLHRLIRTFETEEDALASFERRLPL